MITLTAEKRDEFGKKVNKFRKKGKIPANAYNYNGTTLPLWINTKEIEKASTDNAEQKKIEIKLNNQKAIKVITKSIQKNPVTRQIIHADFQIIK